MLRAIIASVIVVAVYAGGLAVVDGVSGGDLSERLEHERNVAEAWCDYRYNDSGVYQANVIGGHGGLHCAGNEHEPHYHEVREPVRNRVYQAMQNNSTPDISHMDIYESEESGLIEYKSLEETVYIALVLAPLALLQ